MLDAYIYLITTAVITFLMYPVWINFVYKYQMGEDIREDGPASHAVKKGTPSMGGLIFILTTAVVTFIFNQSRTQTLFPIFVASMAGLFGMLEDFSKVYKRSNLADLIFFPRIPLLAFVTFPIRLVSRLISRPWNAFKELMRILGSSQGRGLHSYQKFLIQSAIGGFVAYWTYAKLGWDYLWFPLIGNVHIGFLYPMFIFILFLVVLNFVAFTDGVDGLAAGLAVISFGSFWVISTALNFNSLASLCATFIGALIPFLYFNIHPARIFMGDVGSHVLGAALAVIAVVLHREIVLIFVCLVFLADGASSPLQQIVYKITHKRLFRMAPMHHHFELLGWPETKVTMRFWLFSLFFSFVGIFVALL